MLSKESLGTGIELVGLGEKIGTAIGGCHQIHRKSFSGFSEEA